MAAPKVSSDPKMREKRKAEALRRFIDKNVSAPIGITPKWQRAIDNYKRLKGVRDAG